MKAKDLIQFCREAESGDYEYWLKIGTEIEKEHTDDEEVAKKIASDHLAEDPDYCKDWKNKEKILFKPKVESTSWENEDGNWVYYQDGEEKGSVVQTSRGVYHAYVPEDEMPIGKFSSLSQAKAEVEDVASGY